MVVDNFLFSIIIAVVLIEYRTNSKSTEAVALYCMCTKQLSNTLYSSLQTIDEFCFVVEGIIWISEPEYCQISNFKYSFVITKIIMMNYMTWWHQSTFLKLTSAPRFNTSATIVTSPIITAISKASFYMK